MSMRHQKSEKFSHWIQFPQINRDHLTPSHRSNFADLLALANILAKANAPPDPAMLFDGTDGQDLRRLGVLDETYTFVLAGPAADQKPWGIAVKFTDGFAVPGFGAGGPRTQKEDKDQYRRGEIPAHFHASFSIRFAVRISGIRRPSIPWAQSQPFASFGLRGVGS